MTSLSFRPGPDFLEQAATAAWFFLDRCGAPEAGAHVVVLSRRDCARRIAARTAPCDTIDAADTCTLERVRARCGSTAFERVIETGGVQASLDLATELIAEGGRLVIAGYHQDGTRQVNLQRWNWHGIDVACGVGLMSELCHEIAGKIGALIQRTVCVDLDREALELARERLARYQASFLQIFGDPNTPKRFDLPLRRAPPDRIRAP